MSAETQTGVDYGIDLGDWVGGAVAGVLAGIPFGLLIQFVIGAMSAVGALYGAPGIVTGWIAHLFHSAVFGVIFAGLAEVDALREYIERPTTGWVAGAIYGAVLWAIFLVFVWPIWLQAVGVPQAPSVPFVTPRPIVGHVVYGIVLGGVYPYLR